LPLNIALNEKSNYINLGDWLQYFTYLEFNGNDSILKKWDGKVGQEYNITQ
jgi:UDP-2,3-diacylglucosamine hydrolase